MGVDREMVQGEARDPPEAEGKDRQVRSVARPDGLDSVHRRRHSHSPGLLQDPSGLDNAPAAGR